MIIARAPYRVSFFGGGTDFPVWYKEHGGAVLSTTINKYCYITVRWLPPFFEHKYRIVWSRIELPSTIDEIIHPKVRAVLKYLEIKDGIEIHHAGDLPARTGIGSSSAFTVALLCALHKLLKDEVSKQKLAEEAIYIEQELCQEIVGSQDQFASAFGGLNRINFNSHSIEVKPVSYNIGLERNLMMFFTGFQRNAYDIEREKLKDIQGKKRYFRTLQRLVDKGEQVLKTPNLHNFGQLLDKGWKAKRSMSNNTSTDYINYLYRRGRKAGADGGKLLGAGGGGFLLFYAEPDKQYRVRLALKDLLEVPFRFEDRGTEVVLSNEK